jgi:hypothetical protein
MINIIIKKNYLSLLLLSIINYGALAETNSSTVTNTASPNASSVTSGGTSVNYQTNNSFNNDFGFGPGNVCRTPSLYFGTNANQQDTHNFTSLGGSSANDNTGYGANIGIVVPFGSSVIDSCVAMAKQTSVDKQISSQLSMIRACANLKKDGIEVDPYKFPLLSACVINPGEPELVAKKIKTKISAKPKPMKKVNVLKVPRLIND